MYILQKNEIQAASHQLAIAFENYPIFEYILPDIESRKIKIIHLFNFLLKLGILNGDVIATSKNLEGISIWFNSNNMNLSLFDILRSGLINLKIKLNKSEINRLTDVGNNKKIIRNQKMNGEYYFLDLIGVHPYYHKKGFATALINSKLNEIDIKRIPCYLETSNNMNIAFYERFDFCVIHEYKLFGVNVYCMLRKVL